MINTIYNARWCVAKCNWSIDTDYRLPGRVTQMSEPEECWFKPQRPTATSMNLVSIVLLLYINYTLHTPSCIINSVYHASSYYATEEDNWLVVETFSIKKSFKEFDWGNTNNKNGRQSFLWHCKWIHSTSRGTLADYQQSKLICEI